MQIGILSMQRIVNNGSFLQAYGLKKTLECLDEKDIIFIDFHNPFMEERNNNNSIISALRRVKHIIIPKYWGYEKSLSLDRKYRKRMTKKYQPWLFPQAYNYPSDKEYDLVIFGSDEVFNICQFSDLKKHIPWELLGEGIKAKKMISYAAACGQTDIESIEKIGEIEHCKDLLNRFSALSARDENTINLLQELTSCTPKMHIDPVLLLPEFPLDRTYHKLSYKYMIVYAYSRRIDNSEEIKAIKIYAQKNHMKTVCINCYQIWSDINIVTSPFALLQYIADAECVVTDTFHGTVFSIRNNKRFATIVRDSNRYKLRSLLNQFSLGKREVSEMKDLESILDEPINYETVNNQIIIEREKALDYLREQIKREEKV